MIFKLKLAAALVLAVTTFGIASSANAHVIGGRGGGIRLGGGALLPRARQGIANGNRSNNSGVVRTPAPAPVPAPVPKAAPKPATPPIVTIGGSKSGVSKPAASAATSTTKPPSNNTAAKVAAPVPAAAKAPVEVPTETPTQSEPKKTVSSSNYPSHLVFNLTGSAAPDLTPAPVERPGLSSETRQALEEALANDTPATEVPAAESTPDEVGKEAALPQIPVGATVTLKGKDLSNKEGQVVLQIGEIALPATITDWKNDKVTCTLPVLGLAKSSRATLHVLKADGKTASLLNCELITADAK